MGARDYCETLHPSVMSLKFCVRLKDSLILQLKSSGLLHLMKKEITICTQQIYLQNGHLKSFLNTLCNSLSLKPV